jgi:hypothetical protein
MRKSILALSAIAVFACPATRVMASFIPPSNFPAGTTQYEIIFVTTTQTDATSSSVGTYNSIVQSEVLATPVLNALLPAADWHAIISTPTVDASSNAPSVAGIPVYNTFGQLVAYSSHSSPLYSGMNLTSAPYGTASGDFYSTNPFTGSGLNGEAIPGFEAGSGSNLTAYGYDNTTAPYWLHDAYTLSRVTLPLFGLSEPINVSTPEPASITLLAAGILTAGGFGIVRRRRGRASESNPVAR